jgi:hypothetical protein
MSNEGYSVPAKVAPRNAPSGVCLEAWCFASARAATLFCCFAGSAFSLALSFASRAASFGGRLGAAGGWFGLATSDSVDPFFFGGGAFLEESFIFGVSFVGLEPLLLGHVGHFLDGAPFPYTWLWLGV